MAPHTDDETASRAGIVTRSVYIFLPLTWTALLLRIWVRARLIRNFGWDDATMVLTALTFTSYCATLLVIESNCGGTHVTQFSQLKFLISWSVAAEALYVVAMVVLKISLGIFFMRIVVKNYQRWLILGSVFMVCLTGTGNFFFVLFRCGSPENYLISQLTGKCVSQTVGRFMLYWNGAVNTSTDFLFATLPISILWNANMERRAKISVGMVLLLGLAGSVCSCIRFVYLEGLLDTTDFFWSATNTALWSLIEPGAGIIAGSLATLRPLFRTVIQVTRSISSRTRRASKSFGFTFNSSSHGNRHSRSRSPFGWTPFDKEKANKDKSYGSRSTRADNGDLEAEVELIDYPRPAATRPVGFGSIEQFASYGSSARRASAPAGFSSLYQNPVFKSGTPRGGITLEQRFAGIDIATTDHNSRANNTTSWPCADHELYHVASLSAGQRDGPRRSRSSMTLPDSGSLSEAPLRRTPSPRQSSVSRSFGSATAIHGTGDLLK